jgi:hypothetical protein
LQINQQTIAGKVVARKAALTGGLQLSDVPERFVRNRRWAGEFAEIAPHRRSLGKNSGFRNSYAGR